MNKWLYKNNKYFTQFEKINLKNQYFASSYFIINKNIKIFQSLINIKILILN